MTAFTGSGGFGQRNLGQHVHHADAARERKESVEAVATAACAASLAKRPGSEPLPQPRSRTCAAAAPVGGGTQFTLRGDDFNELAQLGQKLEQALRDRRRSPT
jgi:hypothetical protein